jgi:hypothetical protein
MSRTTLHRISLVLVLAAVLLAPQPSWAGAARHSQPTAAAAQHPAASLLTQAWHHLVSVWARVGSAIDPNGGAVSVSGLGTPVSPTNPRTGG